MIKLKDLLLESNEDANKKLYNTLIGLKVYLAKAAQKVYDEWEQDDEGYDEVYGGGGICDDIAESMCDVIMNKSEYSCTHLYNEYDCHTSIYVYDEKNKIVYNVDIPPHIYEKGYGYTWRKLKDISIKSNHIEIVEVDWEDYFDKNGNFIEY